MSKANQEEIIALLWLIAGLQSIELGYTITGTIFHLLAAIHMIIALAFSLKSKAG